MGVNDFLLGYYGGQRQAAQNAVQPLNNGLRSVALKAPKTATGGLGISRPTPPQSGSGMGYESTQVTSNPSLAGQYPASSMQYSLMSDKSRTEQGFQQANQQSAQEVAQQYNAMAAGVKNTNAYGVAQSSPLQDSNFLSQQESNLGAISSQGINAMQAAQNARAFQNQQNAINANVGYNISYTGAPYNPSNMPAGADPNSKAGQAIAMAMTALHNHIPYVWGGQDLNKGVDCSGLLYTIYNRLGVNLPRSSYEQAKYGKVIQGIGNALPGDLIFYNTGSSDPNGIGVNSHVALYIGNGMVIEAENPRRGIIEAPVGNFNGTIMRPW